MLNQQQMLSTPSALRHFLLKNRQSIWVVFVLSLGFLMGNHETATACGGFLCGPKDELISGLNGADGSEELITRAFLGVNFLVILIIALPTLVGMGKNVGRDEIGWYVATSVLFFVVMLGFNFLGDWIFGITAGAG